MSEAELRQADLQRPIDEFAQEHKAWTRRPVRVEDAGSDQLAAVGLAAHVVLFERTPAEEHIRLLNIAATEHKKADIGQSIAYLRRSRALAAAIGAWSYPTEWYLRLPLFLQQAGRMSEALTEFQWLLTHFDCFKSGYSQADELEIEHARHCYLATIYDKLRVAWKREKNAVKADEAKQNCVMHRSEQERIWGLIERRRMNNG